MTGLGAQGLHTVEGAARAATTRARPWLVRGARMGYAANGIVYLTLGIIALQAATSSGDRPESSRGALATLAEQPFGRALVVVVAIGLLGYAAWRVAAAAADAEGKGSDAKGLAVRAGMAGSGIMHGALGVWAFRLLQGDPEAAATADQQRQAVGWTARLMSMPWGRWLVLAVGLGIVAYGAYQLWRAFTKDMHRALDLHTVPRGTATWITRLARFGIGARGVVFGIVGAFVVHAAWRYDPTRVGGVDDALAMLERGGPPVLGVVATGLVAYGVVQLVRARYASVAT